MLFYGLPKAAAQKIQSTVVSALDNSISDSDIGKS
jgi:hypothetical protein